MFMGAHAQSVKMHRHLSLENFGIPILKSKGAQSRDKGDGLMFKEEETRK